MSTTTETTATTPRPGVRRLLLPALVALVGVVMLVVGSVFLVRGQELRSAPAADNDALVDTSATAQVQAEVSSALTKALTYSYADPKPTSAAAEQVLRGDARTQYAQLFAALQKRAAGEKLELTATVRNVGVQKLTGDKAELLVFLDQTSTRATDARSSVAAAQVAIEARKSGGTWRITELRPL